MECVFYNLTVYEAAKGFNVVRAKLLSLCADSRFENLESSFIKGFNCCGGKLPLRYADSRFAKPWKFPERERFYSFCVVQKEPKSTRGEALRPTIQSSVGKDFAENSGGSFRNRFCLQNAGVKALNRCERVAVLLTQD